MKNYKLFIPNILTAFRIIATPIIIGLGIINQMQMVIILSCIAALTDFFDGRLARKWGTTSSKGAKLDAVSDKIFAIGLTTCLAIHFRVLWILVIFELIIGGANLFFHYQSKKTESLWIGKVKTVILFSTIILVMITYYWKTLQPITNGFIYITINLQFLSLIAYALNFYDHMHPITIEDNEMHQKIMQEPDDMEKTIVVHDLEKLIETIEEENDLF